MVRAGVIVVLLVSNLLGSMHKYYMSITEVEWNEKTQSAEIIMNVFVDDFEKALSEINKRKLAYGDKGFEQAASSYINAGFVIYLPNAKPAPVKLIGLKLSKDIVNIYIEAEHLTTLNSCTIKNSLLTEFMEGQTNMINVIEGNNKRTLILSKSHTEEVIHF